MRRSHWYPLIHVAAIVLPSLCIAAGQDVLSSSVTVTHGAVNGVCIEKGGHRLVVYGDPKRHWGSADMVLLTHGRRDVVWAARALVDNGAESVVPAGAAKPLTETGAFWAGFWDKRFHDYAQQSTKIPTAALKVGRTVGEGDRLQWRDVTIDVLDTPGYTRKAVSYFVEMDGCRYGFVGDVIYGDGHLLDLYSLQDAVSEARIGGYHGYAGRIGELIASLRKIAARKPDVLVPARGPVIEQPARAIGKLIERLQAAYENYLSINAGHWYFKEHYDTLAERALGKTPNVPWMPYAKTIEKTPPDWIVPIHNSRLVIAQDRTGLLIDCGSGAIIAEIRKLREQGKLDRVAGLFITHYHDDHTDRVNEFLQEYDCPVYATPILEDILRRPGAYRLPCVTANAIERLTIVPDRHRRRWKEFTLTFYDFPGQTIYHDALLVEKDDGEKIFFVGDSFTPSGLDDYCLQNRNLLGEGQGYFYCLDLLRSAIPAQALLINEHVLEPFRFDEAQIEHMTETLRRRKDILSDLFPWDEPNFGIDERWARIHPYGQEVRAGQETDVAVRILNHSHRSQTFKVTLNAPPGFETRPAEVSTTAAAGKEAELRFRVTVPARASDGVHVVTADVEFGPWQLHRWSEALLKVAP
ncbi:MAG: MBL fold metallo-hydrolase [Sedimentisphaerales bacterium]|nr:MBL fold metallo-hydrolase [Sedimentisphaerales bacterium]